MNASEPDSGSKVDPASRLERRIKALKRRQRQLIPNTAVKLLTTDELRRALALTERAGVLSNGDVRCPEVFHAASPEEWAALERWTELCGEPLDYIEAAEELLDRIGETNGWRSREAGEAALLLARLRLLDASHWLVGEMAQAVVNFYAELEEHHPRGCGPGPPHSHVRDAVRCLARLKDGVRIASEPSAVLEDCEDNLSQATISYGKTNDTAHWSETVNESVGASEGSSERASRRELRLITEGARTSARYPWWRKLSRR